MTTTPLSFRPCSLIPFTAPTRTHTCRFSSQVDEWRSSYQRDGYLSVPGLLSSGDIAQLKREVALIARGKYGPIDGLQSARDEDSDDSIISRYLCFHHPHKLSPVLHGFLGHPAVVRVLQAIVGPNVKTMQSMFFVKSGGKPGQAWHQDEIYIPTRDRSLVGAWIAVDDASVENGCLWMHPGSHKPGVLYPMKQHNDARFDPAGESQNYPYPREGGVKAEVPAGSVVFFNGYTLHRSLPNLSRGFRRAYCVHYMSAESYLPWDCDGSIPKTDDNRDIVLVSGVDPYAHRGVVTNLTFPFIRPDKSVITDVEGRGALAAAMANKTKSSKP